MISHVITIVEGMKMNKQKKTKIGMGSVVKAKVRDLEKRRISEWMKLGTSIGGMLLRKLTIRRIRMP